MSVKVSVSLLLLLFTHTAFANPDYVDKNDDLSIFHFKMAPQKQLFKFSDLNSEQQPLEKQANPKVKEEDDIEISCAYAAAYAAMVFDRELSKDSNVSHKRLSKELNQHEKAKEYVQVLAAGLYEQEGKGLLSYLNTPYALRAYPTVENLALWISKSNPNMTVNHAFCDLADTSPSGKTIPQIKINSANDLALTQLIDPSAAHPGNLIANAVKEVTSGRKKYAILILPEHFPNGGHYVAVAIRKTPEGKIETFLADGLNKKEPTLVLKGMKTHDTSEFRSMATGEHDRTKQNPVAMIQYFAQPEVELKQVNTNFSDEIYRPLSELADFGGIPIPVPCDMEAKLPSVPYATIQDRIKSNRKVQLSRATGEPLEGISEVTLNGQSVKVNAEAGITFKNQMDGPMFDFQETLEEIGDEGIEKFLAVASVSGRDPKTYYSNYLKPALFDLFKRTGDEKSKGDLEGYTPNYDEIAKLAKKLKKSCVHESKEQEFRNENFGECHLKDLAETIKRTHQGGKSLSADDVVTFMQKTAVSIHSMSGTSGCSSVMQLGQELRKREALSSQEVEKLLEFTRLLNAIVPEPGNKNGSLSLYHEYLDNIMWLGADLDQTTRILRKLLLINDYERAGYLKGILAKLREGKSKVSPSDLDEANRARVHELMKSLIN